MREIVQLCRGALLLDTHTFIELRKSAEVFQKGVLVIVVISLIVGLVTSAVGFVQAVTAPEEQRSELEPGRDRASEIVELLGDRIDAETQERLRGYITSAMEAGARIAETPAPLPAMAGDLFEAVGQFVSYPFGWLSAWMLYGLLVLMAAKILRGRATVQQMLGCTALAVVPFILGVFGFIPQLGYWPVLIAFLWGLVIYIMGTAVANEFGVGKAILAVILPILVILLVGLVRLLDDLLPYSHRHDHYRRTADGG
ncbi:MAG: Yip1 family protein [Anaerolineae bacterium]